VDVSGIAMIEGPTGHAIINVDAAGENSIVLHAGANGALTEAMLHRALDAAAPGDWFLTQNETVLVAEAMAAARARGLKTAHAAAPFDPAACGAALPHTDLLAVNEGEAAALARYLGTGPEALPVERVLVTLGARGERLHGPGGTVERPAFAVAPVDTTGAGDCFLGAALAALDA
ncbi:MAG: PfkB family carbohydrate kinase, partial [Pseudomonadota bacterium]